MKGIFSNLSLRKNNSQLLENDEDIYDTISDEQLIDNDIIDTTIVDTNNNEFNFRNELLKCNNDTEMFSRRTIQIM